MSPAKSKSRQADPGKTQLPQVEELSYEQALAELEKLVASLETDKLSLEESVALFERGQALTRRCFDLLDKAELRVKQLSGNSLVDMPPEE